MCYDLNSKVFILLLIFYSSIASTVSTVPKWNYYKQGDDWPDSCQVGPQAPINIEGPFKFRKLNLTFFYSKMNTEYTLYNNGNNLILEGDYGYIVYNNSTFFSTEAKFFSPSAHHIANKTLPLEMQIIHNDNRGNKIVISILFKKSKDYSVLLGQLGFDKPTLRDQIPFQNENIRENVDLSKYVSIKKDFLFYEALESHPPCKAKTVYLILTDMYKVTEFQLKNFPKLMFNKTRRVFPRKGRTIYSSFKIEDALKKKQKLKKRLEKIESAKNAKKEMNEVSKQMEKKEIELRPKIIHSNTTFKGLSNKTNLNATKSKNLTNTTRNKMKPSNNTNSSHSPNSKSKPAVAPKPIHTNKTKTNKTAKGSRIVNASNITNRTNSTNETIEVFTEPCVEIVPFNVVKNKAVALTKIKKFRQPEFFSVPHKPNDTMVVEYELPKSNAEIMSMNLEAKQKYLHHLYKKSVLSPGDPFIFLQIKKLETLLTESNLSDDFSSFYVMDDMILGSEENLNELIEVKAKPENKTANVSRTTTPSKEIKQEQKSKLISSAKIANQTKAKTITKPVQIAPQIIESPPKIDKDKEIREEFMNYRKNEPKLPDPKDKETKEIQGTLNSVRKLIDNQQKKVDTIKGQLEYRGSDYREEIKQLMKANQEKKKVMERIKLEIEKEKRSNPKNWKRIKKNHRFSSSVNKFGKNIRNKLKKIHRVLREKVKDKNCKLKKLTEKQLARRYNFTSRYDKRIYMLFKLILTRIYQEFRTLDKIAEIECDNHLINSKGYLRISHKNLAEIIKNAYDLQNRNSIKFDSKLNSLHFMTRKLLLAQNLELQTHPENDLDKVSVVDIKQIVDEIFQKNILNKSEFRQHERQRVKNLIVEIMESLPITLVTKTLYKKKYLGGEKHVPVQPTSPVVIDRTNIDSKLLNKFLKNQAKEKTNEVSPIGEGRKPKNRKGVVDRTEIWDISSWPEQCKTDYMQSPINLNYPYDPEILLFKMNYKLPKGPIIFLNDGYKLILRAEIGEINYGLHKYFAKEIHFHFPSEHTFGDDETRSPLEMQIIHQDMFGNIAAVAVLFDISLKDNKFLQELGFGVDDPNFALKLRDHEAIKLKPNPNFNLGPFLNGIRHYVHYQGSITTPPCNKGVEWFVLLDKLDVSQQQLDYFPVLFGLNSNVRGLQQLGQRVPKII